MAMSIVRLLNGTNIDVYIYQAKEVKFRLERRLYLGSLENSFPFLFISQKKENPTISCKRGISEYL